MNYSFCVFQLVIIKFLFLFKAILHTDIDDRLWLCVVTVIYHLSLRRIVKLDLLLVCVFKEAVLSLSQHDRCEYAES